MSTTIYNGKKMPNMSLFELNEFYKHTRLEMMVAAKQEYYKFVVRIAQEIYVYLMTNEYVGHYDIDLKEIDSKANEFKDDAYALLDYARESANRIVRKTSDAIFTYDSEDDADFDVSVVILPINGKTLCMPYAHNDILNNLLNSNENFEEYAYWNNTDKPDAISKEEWDLRRKDWDEALPCAGIPKNNGIVLHLVDAVSDIIEHHSIDIRPKVVDFLGDDDEMIRKVANNIILHREYLRLAETDEIKQGRDHVTIAMRCLRLATDYIKDHPNEIEETKSTYRDMVNSKEFFSIGLLSVN